MIILKNKKTGQEVQCIGLWANTGIKNPRRLYALPDMQGHQADEFINFVGYVTDKYGCEWKVFAPVSPWTIISR